MLPKLLNMLPLNGQPQCFRGDSVQRSNACSASYCSHNLAKSALHQSPYLQSGRAGSLFCLPNQMTVGYEKFHIARKLEQDHSHRNATKTVCVCGIFPRRAPRGDWRLVENTNPHQQQTPPATCGRRWRKLEPPVFASQGFPAA